jgi:hypothetical protein
LLPALHAAAIVLDDEGLDQEAIAARLGLDPFAISTLLDIARGKLAALEHAPR